MTEECTGQGGSEAAMDGHGNAIDFQPVDSADFTIYEALPEAAFMAALTTSTHSATVVVDSGASSTFVSSAAGLTNYVKIKGSIKTAGKDSKSVKIVGVGFHPLWGKVKHAPDMRYTLLSTSQLWRQHGWTTTLSDTCKIEDEHGRLIACSSKTTPSGLFIIEHVCPTSIPEGVHLAQEVTPLLRHHYNFGHAPINVLRNLARDGVITDVTQRELKTGLPLCPACIEAKMKRKPFPKTPKRVPREGRLELVHSDISRLMSVESMGNYYFVLYIDDSSSYKWIYPLRHKSDTHASYIRFEKEVARHEGTRIGTLRTDDGGEYISSQFMETLRATGTRHQTTARHSPAQNGISERAMQTVCNMARTSLRHAGLSAGWWWPACKDAVYKINCLPTAAQHGKIPYQIWHRRRPNFDLLKPFGVICYAHVPDALRTKWDMKAVKGIYIGVDEGRKCYTIYVLKTDTIIYSRDVVFLEDAAQTGEWLTEGAADPSPPSTTKNSLTTAKVLQAATESAAGIERKVAATKPPGFPSTARPKSKRVSKSKKLPLHSVAQPASAVKATAEHAIAVNTTAPPLQSAGAPGPTTSDNATSHTLHESGGVEERKTREDTEETEPRRSTRQTRRTSRLVESCDFAMAAEAEATIGGIITPTSRQEAIGSEQADE